MTNGDKTREVIKEFIVQYFKEHGYGPSYQEIGEAVGLSSKSSVSSHITKMLDTGMIDKDAGKPRTIRIPGYHFSQDRKTD